MCDIKLEDIFSLVYQNFDFLHLGKFLDEYVKRNNISESAKDIIINVSSTNYKLNSAITKELLSTIFTNRNQASFFGYLITWNAFRGIMMAVHEGKKNEHFRNYLEGKLTIAKFKHFECIVSFIRNVLSHNIENEIRLRNADFRETKKYFSKRCTSEIAQIDIIYSRDFPEATVLGNYGFNIKVDFSKIKAGDKFIDIISEYQLYMLSELCVNLCKLYKK